MCETAIGGQQGLGLVMPAADARNDKKSSDKGGGDGDSSASAQMR
jgi:hypothetical protein